jgi:hypothetical protein
MTKTIHRPADYTASLRFSVSGGAIDIQIQPDPQPSGWLGRFSVDRVRGAVRIGKCGPDKPFWYVPDIPAEQIEAALLAFHGRQRARRLAHERIREDRIRLAEYGKTWSLYRLTVSLCREGCAPVVETIAGLAACDLPVVGNAALVERVVASLLSLP